MLKKLFLVPFLCVVLSSIDSKCSLNEDENLINDTRTSLPREEKKSPRKLLKEAKCLKKFHKNPHLSYEIMENILSDVGHSDKLYSHQLSWGKDLYAYESPELF